MTRLARLAEARIAHAHVVEARETALIERMERAEIRCRYPFLFPPRLTQATADRLRAELRAQYAGPRSPYVVMVLPDAEATAEAMVRRGVFGRAVA